MVGLCFGYKIILQTNGEVLCVSLTEGLDCGYEDDLEATGGTWGASIALSPGRGRENKEAALQGPRSGVNCFKTGPGELVNEIGIIPARLWGQLEAMIKVVGEQ